MGTKKSNKIIILGPDNNSFGGIATCINNIVKSNISSDFDIFHIKTGNISNAKVSFSGRITRTLNQLNQLLNNRHDALNKVIHIHTASEMSFWRYTLFITLSKLLGIKILLHIHGASFKEFYNDSNIFNKYLISSFIESCSHLVVLSSHWYDFFSHITPKIEKTVLENSYLTELSFDEINRKKDFSSLKILFLGAITQRKGIEEILKCIEKIGYVSDIKFKICGFIVDEESHLVTKLQNLASKSSNLNLEFNISNDRKKDLFLDSNLFILPTFAEGLPIAMLEAMSYSMAIISTPVGAIPEVISNNKNGFLISPGDSSELKEKILFLYNNMEKLREMGLTNQQDFANRFSNDVMSKKLSSIYKELHGK